MHYAHVWYALHARHIWGIHGYVVGPAPRVASPGAYPPVTYQFA